MATAKKAKETKAKEVQTDFGSYKSNLPEPPNYKEQYETLEAEDKAKQKAKAKAKKAETKKKEKPAAAPAPAPEKHAGGRPPKSDEPLRVCSFRLKEMDYRKLKAVAASRGQTAGDLIAEYIATLPSDIKF